MPQKLLLQIERLLKRPLTPEERRLLEFSLMAVPEDEDHGQDGSDEPDKGKASSA